MKKWVLIFTLVLVPIVGIAFYQSWPSTDRIQEKSIYHFLPGEPPFIMDVQNLRKLPRSFTRLRGSRAVRNSPGARFYKQRLLPLIRILQHADPSHFPNSLRKLKRVVGNQALFFADTGPHRFIGVLKLHANDASANQPYRIHDQLLNTHIIQPLKASKRFDYDNHSMDGLIIHQFKLREPFDDGKFKLARFLPDSIFSLGRIQNHLLVGFGPSALEETFRRFQNSENPGDGLFVDNTPEDFQTRFYLNPAFVSQGLEHWTQTHSEMESIPETSPSKYTEMNDVTRVHGDVFEENGFFKMEGRLEWTPDPHTEIKAHSQDQEPRALQFDRYLPPKTIYFQSQLIPEADLLFSHYQNQILQPTVHADSISKNPEWLATKGIRSFFEHHKQELGWAFYYRDDFFKSITQADKPEISSPPIHLILGFEMDNESSVSEALRSLGSNPFIDYKPDNDQIHVDLILRTLPIYLKRVQAFLLMATDPKILGDLTEKRTNHNTLRTQKPYQIVRKKLPEQLNVLTYFSGEKFTSPLRYPWLQRFIPKHSRQIQRLLGFDPLTEIHNIARQTPPTIGGIWNEPDQTKTRFRLYTSGDILLPPAILGGLRAAQTYVQNDFLTHTHTKNAKRWIHRSLDTQSIRPEYKKRIPSNR